MCSLLTQLICTALQQNNIHSYFSIKQAKPIEVTVSSNECHEKEKNSHSFQSRLFQSKGKIMYFIAEKSYTSCNVHSDELNKVKKCHAFSMNTAQKGNQVLSWTNLIIINYHALLNFALGMLVMRAKKSRNCPISKICCYIEMVHGYKQKKKRWLFTGNAINSDVTKRSNVRSIMRKSAGRIQFFAPSYSNQAIKRTIKCNYWFANRLVDEKELPKLRKNHNVDRVNI